MSAQISLLSDIKSRSGSGVKLDYEFNNHANGSSPLSNVFRQNIEALHTLTSTGAFDYIKFNNTKWDHAPDIFCSDYYGNPDLYLVILLVNKLKSRFEFVSTNLNDSLIIAPKISTIQHLLSTI